MNGLPQLRTDWMPDIGNALLRAEQIKGERMQNQLAQQQMAERPEERNWLMEQRGAQRAGWGRAEAAEQRTEQEFGVQTQARAVSGALQGKTIEQQKQIFNDLGGKGTFEVIGPNVKLTAPDNSFIIEAPQKIMQELGDQLQKDPSFLTDPEKTRQTFAWIAARGGSVTRGKPVAYQPGTRKEMLEDFAAKEAMKAKQPTAAQQIAQRKLEAIDAILAGTATPGQERILGKEGKFWVNKAAAIVSPEMTDPRNRKVSREDWGKRILDLAESMRIASEGKGQTGPTAGGKAYDFIPGKGLVAR